ncbi:hypothetical protein [Niveispirillum sp.]|uniref:hypothetical protein n=1 Tax=Niveispirillum sp. TaxID=1917217 RepID=UPI001B7745B9|nr:hypothetical protein [Niveispirillum sp.]MBP7335410.1 hypothetical protein [Niveispirillum sp.]
MRSVLVRGAMLCLLLAASVIAPSHAALAPDDEGTWRACDGQGRPSSAAAVTGVKVALLPLLLLAPDRPPVLPRPEGLAFGVVGIEACRAAMSDPRSREWPDRRTMQHLAMAVHLLDAGLQGGADLSALPAAKAAWLADKDSSGVTPAVRWMIEPLFDLVLAVGAAERRDPKAAALLSSVIDRRPGSYELAALTAEASLSQGIDMETRRRLWWHAASHEQERVLVAMGLRAAQSAPFLPSREMLRDTLIPLLHDQLVVASYANRVDLYSAKGTFSSDGYVSESSAAGELITYQVDKAPVAWARELALFRAAELAAAAGQTRFVLLEDRSAQLVARQFTGYGAYAGSYVMRNDVTLLVGLGGPPAGAAPVSREPAAWMSVDKMLTALNGSFLKQQRATPRS